MVELWDAHECTGDVGENRVGGWWVKIANMTDWTDWTGWLWTTTTTTTKVNKKPKLALDYSNNNNNNNKKSTKNPKISPHLRRRSWRCFLFFSLRLLTHFSLFALVARPPKNVFACAVEPQYNDHFHVFEVL